MKTSLKYLAVDITGLMVGIRAQGGGVARLALIAGKPVIAGFGLPMLIPADLSDREIVGQAKLYAEELMEGRAA